MFTWRGLLLAVSSIVSSQPIQLDARIPIPRRDEAWLRAARRARILSWISLVWMGAEGVLGITLGVLAGSIALIGFGLDSFIEGVASLVIVWRSTVLACTPRRQSNERRGSWPRNSSSSRRSWHSRRFDN